MSEPAGTLIVSDDLMIALNGKFSILGMYTGDIVIQSDPTTSPQLVCLFLVEGPLETQPHSVAFEIMFPGSTTPRRMETPVSFPTAAMPDRKQWTFKWPFLVSQVVLRPGKIRAKVIFNKGEAELAIPGPWISIAQQ
jgi:hypothetical protein